MKCEKYYQKKRMNPNIAEMTTSEFRLMIVKDLRDAWTEVVENKKTIYRAFEKTWISLETEESEKCTFKDNQRPFLPVRALYTHDKFHFLFLIVERIICL